MQDIEHIDDLPASALFFRGYVEKNIALYQLIERCVNGFILALRRQWCKRPLSRSIVENLICKDAGGRH